MSQRHQVPGHLLTQLEKTVLQHMPDPRPDVDWPVLPDRSDRFHGVLDAMRAWVCEFDDRGHMLYASPQVESILGFTPEQCLTEDCLEFHPDDLPKVVELGRRVRETGEPGSNLVRIRHARGDWLWLESSLVGWRSVEDSSFHTICLARDVTRQRAAEAAQRESDARYRIVSAMSRDVIIEVDQSGRASYVAASIEEITGYTPEEFLELDPWSLMHPDDVARIREQLAREFQANPIDDLETAAPKRGWMMEFRFRHRDGRWLYLETFGLIYRRADEQTRFLAVTRDVSERRLAEEARRKLQESMQRSQKLEGLGVLAGGIAHDFNNLLTPILGSASLALLELPEDSPVRGRLEMVQRAARRAAALTDQMLAYAGQSPLRLERLDLSEIVAEMQELVASAITGPTILDLELEDGLPAIEGEAGQLGQVVMNLITNAAESATEGAGRITVRTGVVDIDAPPQGALFADTMTPGRHVYFEVEDCGAGMDEETRTKIFDPFFTTKFTGRGLGLAAVAGIVRSHQGAIEVDSKPGRGTRFRVLLPAVLASAEIVEQESAPRGDWRPSGTALVIDDDEAVREFVEDALRGAGMASVSAADGHEGVKLFARHADEIRVVLLDRAMPGLSGTETFDAIRALRPDAKIVLVSGYSEERVSADLSGRHIAGFLKKPFSPEKLLERIREVLEAA